MVAAATSEARRACVRACVCVYARVCMCERVCECVCTGERAQRVRGRAPRSPARPATACCSPRCDAGRIPNARSHRPCAHTRAHLGARTPPPPHTRLRTRGSRPPRELIEGPSCPNVLAARPLLDRPRLTFPDTPRGHPTGVPAPPLCPAPPWSRSQPSPGPAARLLRLPTHPACGSQFFRLLLLSSTCTRPVPGLSRCLWV